MNGFSGVLVSCRLITGAIGKQQVTKLYSPARWKTKKIILLLVVVLCLSGGVVVAEPININRTYDFDIPSLQVRKALGQVAKKTKFQLVFSSKLVDGLQSIAVKGQYTVAVALDRLLKGTSLSGSITERGVIVVTSVNSQNNTGMGRRKMKAKKSLLASMIGFFVGAGAVQEVAAQENAQAGRFIVEEVVVTAQKRGEQNLSDTPISIGVLKGDDFESSSVRDLSEALNLTSGVNLFSQAPGQTTISIRGAGNDAKFSGGTTSGFYLDETPFGFSRSGTLPDTGVYDLARVEVLRGPQGTLYGTSSLNGVVRVITMDANLEEFEFKARSNGSSTDGGGDNYSGDFAINIPLIEGKLALRGVASYADFDGWIDTTEENIVDGIAAENINNGTAGNYRLKMNAAPIDYLDVEAGVWFSRVDTGAPSLANNKSITPMSGRQPQQQDFDIYSLEIGYEFDNFTLLSATNYLDMTQHSISDYGAPSGTFGTPITPNNYSSKASSQEVRLASTLDGHWQWSAGVSFRETEEQIQQAIPAVRPGIIDAIDESESWAIFGEVTRSFWDGLADLTVGMRYYETTIILTEFENLSLRRPLINAEETFDDISPRLVLTFYPYDELTIYSSISKGFRSGLLQDPNALVAESSLDALIEPDTLWNYEIGAKGRLMDGRFTYETALYYVDWDDVQQKFASQAGTAAVVNTESANGYGVDININLQPVEGLTMGLGVGWSGLEFAEDVTAESINVTAFEEGDRLNQSPEYTASLSVSYEFPLGMSGLQGKLGGSVNYHSELEQRALVATAVRYSQGDKILNARLNFSVQAEHWTTMLYVDNATNEDGTVNAPGFSTIVGSQLRPRTVGLQISYDY
jgi:iron complex outermembrane recepter protein